jgi:hypothetical protein
MNYLYRVCTVLPEHHGYHDLEVAWFKLGGEAPLSYADAISDYETGKDDAIYPMLAIDQMFTCDEATALKAYLDRHHSDRKHSIIKVHLPIPFSTRGDGPKPLDDGHRIYRLDEEPEYDLPFQVGAYFDLSIGKEIARLCAEHPGWTNEQVKLALAKWQFERTNPLPESHLKESTDALDCTMKRWVTEIRVAHDLPMDEVVRLVSQRFPLALRWATCPPGDLLPSLQEIRTNLEYFEQWPEASRLW